MDNFKNIFSLEGKKALVVGIGGLGTAMAAALVQNGADLAVANRSIEKAKELQELCEKENKEFMAIQVDLLDPDSVEKMVKQVKKKLGRIDILVNAAGMNILKKAEEYDAASWDQVMDVNVKGMHLVTSCVGRVMIQQNYGRILNISSVKGFIGTGQDYTAYCASKGAANMYTKQIACEWGKYGITCNAIAPTFTRTPINAFQLDDPEFYGALVKRIPLGRICTGKDLGAAAVYLCSDAAAFVSGQILAVDGGLTAMQ